MKRDVLIIGAALVDILTTAKALERIDITKETSEHLLCMPFASKSVLRTLITNPGGSALNVAITLDCLGSKVALVSAVGEGAFGDYILDHVKKTGIESLIDRRKTATGIGINLVSAGEKSALVFHGACDELSASHLTAQMVKDSKRILITSIPSKKNQALFRKALRLARQHRVPVIFAPSMTMLSANPAAMKKLRYKFDIAIMNYAEGMFITGKKDVKDVLKKLPAKVAVITRDKDGAFARDGTRYLHVKALPIRIVNTTGAGDVFCGSFVHHYYTSKDLKEALKMATITAGMKLRRMEGAVQCFPPQVARFFVQYEKHLRVVSI